MIGNVKEEFPDFDDELPEIEGFSDRSWHNEPSPTLINEELGLLLFIDYKDPEKSEYPEGRKNGEFPRYGFVELDENGQISEDKEGYHTDSFDEVIAFIEKRRAERAPTTKI